LVKEVRARQMCHSCYGKQQRAKKRAKNVQRAKPESVQVEMVMEPVEVERSSPVWGFDEYLYDIEPGFVEALEDMKDAGAGSR
jgi:hypothetical protein